MDWYVQWFGNPYQDPYYDTQRGQDQYYQEPQYQPYYDEQQYNVSQPQYQQGSASLWYVQPQQYLNNYADVYSQSNPALSQQYRDAANQAGMRWETQNNILNWYDSLAHDVANRQAYVTNMSGDLANSLLWDINNQRDYIYSLYWPNGSITQEVNDYYSGLSNAISWDTGRQLAQSDVNAKTAGVSVWANRNTQNQIYNEGYERALKAKEADINAKNNIVSALQNYMTALRTEYWDTTDKYIIQKYQQANDLLNQIESSMTQDMVNLENSKLQFNMQRALQAAASSSQQQQKTEPLTAEEQQLINALSLDLLNGEDPTVIAARAKSLGIEPAWENGTLSTQQMTNIFANATNWFQNQEDWKYYPIQSDWKIANTPFAISWVDNNKLYDIAYWNNSVTYWTWERDVPVNNSRLVQLIGK